MKIMQAEEIKACSPISESFHQFEPVDLALCLPIAPNKRKSSPDSSTILPQSFGKPC